MRVGALACTLLALATRPSLSEPVRTVCADCHTSQGAQFASSIHATALRCQDCHGGFSDYSVEPARTAEWVQRLASPETWPPPGAFDHGEVFRGKASRKDIPTVCGECHADVGRMNPYGLRTDQLASYWVSGHGKQLKKSGDTRVAVCVDCHGSHDILRHDHPKSRTFFQNVPATCGRCHSDSALMAPFGRSANIPAQYAESVHGLRVLGAADPGAPNCATCHGSHAAAPPGVAEVGHVCGKCHLQIEHEFMSGIHGRLPLFPRCVGCHAQGGAPHDHRIREASASTPELVDVFRGVLPLLSADEGPARTEFARRIDALPNTLPVERACTYCHSGGRTDPHAQLMVANDRIALAKGADLAAALRRAQFDYARAAERVERLGRGVLLVKDEAVRVEEIRTELLALNAALHSLDSTAVHDRVRKLGEICTEVQGALDAKESGLSRRRQMVGVVWGFIALFVVMMYRQYRILRAQYVVGDAHTARPVPLPQLARSPSAASIGGRRRFLEYALRAMGVGGVAAILWPAIAYVFPVRRRGGAGERVSAGKQEGWSVWEIRKVSVGGKAVGVIRTDSGFKAFSLVCTHLGCIVQWNAAKREFECPCHAARFDMDGRVTAGPPPSPLPAYSVAAAQGEVIVTSPG